MYFDEEIEELPMFHCLHDDDCDDIDLHLYEMHVDDDDGVPRATPKMLRVDAQQLVCLRGVEPKHRAEYIKAASKEPTGLLQLGTFAIYREGECDDLKPLGSKFVLKIKYLADDSLDNRQVQGKACRLRVHGSCWNRFLLDMVTDGVADIYSAYLFNCGSLRHGYIACRRPIGILPI